MTLKKALTDAGFSGVEENKLDGSHFNGLMRNQL